MISQRESLGDYKTSGLTYFSILLYSHFTAYWKSLSSQSRIRKISGHIFFLKWLLFAISCLSPRKLLLKYWNRKDHMSISSTRFHLSPIQSYRAVNPPSVQGSRVSKTTPCLVPSSLQYRGRYRSPRISDDSAEAQGRCPRLAQAELLASGRQEDWRENMMWPMGYFHQWIDIEATIEKEWGLLPWTHFHPNSTHKNP